MKDLPDHTKSYLEALVVKKLGLDELMFKLIPSSRDNYVFLNKPNRLLLRVSLTKKYADVKSEADLLKYLRNHNFPVPEVVDYSFVNFRSKEYPFIVFRYIDHEQNINIGKKQVELAAKLLGNLHNLTADYCQNYKFEQQRTLDQDLLQLQKNLADGSSKAVNSNGVLDDLKWGISFYRSRSNKITTLVLHNDYRINNVLFATPDKIACVIDFDWSLKSPFALKDLGHAALEWSYPDGSGINLGLYNHFVSQYWKSNTPFNKVPISEVWEWSRFSALADTAHYFLSFPERTQGKFESYMYNKYLFFKNNGTQ